MSLLGINKKGKLVVGGLVAFALIATASTGLAAWVVGTQTGTDTDGNITVDTEVIDNQVSIELDTASSKLDVYFGPTEEGGTVVKPGEGTERFEKLDLKIAGTVNHNLENLDLDSMNVKMFVTSTLENYVETYFTFPSGGTYVSYADATGEDKVEGTLGYYEYTISEFTRNPKEDKTGTGFTLEFKFGWGSKFNFMNPCAYYTEASQANEALEALETMAEFSNNVNFKVKLKANCSSANV